MTKEEIRIKMKTIKLTLIVEVPDSFPVSQSAGLPLPDVSDEELNLDDAIAEAIAEAGYRLVDSASYEEVPEE